MLIGFTVDFHFLLPSLLLDLGSVGGWATLFPPRPHNRYSIVQDVLRTPYNMKVASSSLQSHHFFCLYLITCVIHKQGPCDDPGRFIPNHPGKSVLYSREREVCQCSGTENLSHLTLWVGLTGWILCCGEQRKVRSTP